MAKCSCWVKYPNECKKRANGKWLCVDKYRCVKNTDGVNKTVCESVNKRSEILSERCDSRIDD